MIEHTLELDIDTNQEDLAHYENCVGVIGITGYKNVITLYYAQTPGMREIMSLATAIHQHMNNGVHVINAALEQEAPLAVVKQRIQETLQN